MFFFFFFFNKEHKFGFKKLTQADLGLGPSHQTHIGLSGNMFSFLQDTGEVRNALLIYENYSQVLDCSFDRIKMPNGKYRSAKIRVGNDQENSVVSKIRHFAKQAPNVNWYLLYSSLESEELVFWLIKEGTKDFAIISKLFTKDGVYGEESPSYEHAKDVLERKMNTETLDVKKDIEVASQLGDIKGVYKRTDVEKAEAIFKKLGKKGEEYVEEYLSKEKYLGHIKSFEWENKSKESGLPYDFIIDGNKFVDVKSTTYDFEQPLYFSDKEIEFATTNDSMYGVYRLYHMTEDNVSLKICTECNPYLLSMDKQIKFFTQNVEKERAIMRTVKLGIHPQICFSNIQPSIKIK
jgi:hypothetical protein